MVVGAGLLILVALALVIIAWQTQPRVSDIEPASGTVNVIATSSIRLVFSRKMLPESVTSRLVFEPTLEGEFTWDKNTLTFIPGKPLPGGMEIKIRLEGGVRASSWLTFPMHSHEWSFTTRQAGLLYLAPSDGPANLYDINPASGEIQTLTKGKGVLEFSVNHEGSMIYFSAGNNQGGASLYQIDRMKAALSPGNVFIPKELLDCGAAQCRSPVVSYDGADLAYEYLIPDPAGGISPAQIWLMHLATLKTTALGQTDHETVQPAWSSAGWLAYYDRTSTAYVLINPLTQESLELPNQTGQPGNWSPDGEYYLAPEIFYLLEKTDREIGTSHIMRYGRESEEATDLSGDNDVEDVEGIYTPDGELIAFVRKYLDDKRWSFGRQIWVMNADGSNARAITDESEYTHYDLAWSRDGQLLAYVRFDQAKLFEPPELWIIRVDGNYPLQLVKGGYSPAWIP